MDWPGRWWKGPGWWSTILAFILVLGFFSYVTFKCSFGVPFPRLGWAVGTLMLMPL
jgi:hypothetical protein